MHKITNVPLLKIGLGVMNSTLENHLMGSFRGFKMVPCKNVDFFGPSKSLNFVLGPFRILELAAFSDLAGLILQPHATFNAQVH